MTSRERMIKTLNHEDPGKVVVDLGSTAVTGISASSLNKLRKALGLEEQTVKVREPFQVLGQVEEDTRKALGIDVVGISNNKTFFGYKNQHYKKWQLFDGTPVLIGEGFKYTISDNGDLLVYPKGDFSEKPSGRMPKGGIISI